jgi:hypothetical protein
VWFGVGIWVGTERVGFKWYMVCRVKRHLNFFAYCCQECFHVLFLCGLALEFGLRQRQ